MSATAAPPATPRIAGYETHPAAAIFPLLAGEDLERLTADVKAHGLLHPITLHEGQILDGRNRALACERAGVPVRTTPWTGSGSPVAWVVSQNLHRRHLTASQRAMVGAALVPLFEEEAKERERIGGREKGRANLPEAEKGRAREKAAEIVRAADDMLEALRGLASFGAKAAPENICWCDDYSNAMQTSRHWSGCQKARAAIAKAEGKATP